MITDTTPPRAVLSLGRLGCLGGVTFGEASGDLDFMADALLHAVEHMAEAMPLIAAADDVPDGGVEGLSNCLCTVLSLANVMRFEASRKRREEEAPRTIPMADLMGLALELEQEQEAKVVGSGGTYGEGRAMGLHVAASRMRALIKGGAKQRAAGGEA